ncbi:AMIN domain-containing protein [Gloeocapsa sp. BRSZ]
MQKFRVAFGRLNWQLWIVSLVLIAPSSVRADTQTPQLSETKLPANSAQLLAQTPTIPTNVVLISGVRANSTDTGVEVILETTQREQLQVINRSSGNNYIADIPGAQLRLPNNDAFAFRSENPVAGITQITVTNIDANTVRVAVTGEAALPTVELFDSNEGLIFGFVTAASAAQQPQTLAEDDELIEILVTGEQDGYRVPNTATVTRTDTPLRDIPQSIQIIPRELVQC